MTNFNVYGMLYGGMLRKLVTHKRKLEFGWFCHTKLPVVNIRVGNKDAVKIS